MPRNITYLEVNQQFFVDGWIRRTTEIYQSLGKDHLIFFRMQNWQWLKHSLFTKVNQMKVNACLNGVQWPTPIRTTMLWCIQQMNLMLIVTRLLGLPYQIIGWKPYTANDYNRICIIIDSIIVILNIVSNVHASF